MHDTLGLLTGTGLLLGTLAVLVTAIVLVPHDDRRGSPGRLLLVGATGVLVVIASYQVATRAATGALWRPREDLFLLMALLVLGGSAIAMRKAGRPATFELSSAGAIDGLTRVASHRAFQDRLIHECERAYRFGDAFTLLLLDLDQFQLVNNRYGHRTGDRILLELAGRITTLIREIDLCARFGGDQFAIVLPHTFQTGAVELAERMRQSIAAWTFLTAEAAEVRLTASIGVSLYPQDGTSAPELVDAAKRSVMFAKRLGGNQVQVFRELTAVPDVNNNVISFPASSHGTIVRSLAAAVDVRDQYTLSHSRVVSELSAATARRLGLRSAEVGRIQIGALLHDVGKIGVPDAILSKEGSLTVDEWESVRQHPVLGKTIIEQAPELRNVIPLVLHHQERFDGSGYPSRLAGEAIPLGARIIAAADAYHAIRSDRPYRSGRTHKQATEELQRCSGSQFDPSCVAALLDALGNDEGLEVIMSSLGLSSSADTWEIQTGLHLLPPEEPAPLLLEENHLYI